LLPATSYQLPPAPCTLYPVLVIALAHAGMMLLTWLFLIGAVGSLVVIFLSFFEDLTELFGKE
jgi:hypothetical protein